MGWTFTQTNETVKGFMDRTFAGWEGKEFKTKMLASGINKNVYYAAMESIPQDGVIGKAKEVWALVCPVSTRKIKSAFGLREVGYKDMTENWEPFYYDVPKKVWDILEANKQYMPDSKGARNWRDEVRKHKAEYVKPVALQVGVKIKLKNPAQFSCCQEDEFIVMQTGRKKIFQSVKYGFICKLCRQTLQNGYTFL